MLILSPGSIRGCGNAKVVKAVVAMVMVLHRERGALCRVLLGDCCLLTSAGQGRVLQFGPWASGDLGNVLPRLRSSTLPAGFLGRESHPFLPQFPVL